MQLKDFPLSITVAACITGAALVANVFAAPKERAKSIDLSELQAAQEKRFAAADTDGDGLVSTEEFAALDPRAVFPRQQFGQRGREGARRGPGAQRRGPGPEAIRQRMEQRRAEIEKRLADREKRQQEARTHNFETADSDGDGQLSPDEYSDMPATLRAARQKEMFARLDEDGDGKLSREEFPSVVGRLKTLDADEDGVVTRKEMRAGWRR